MKAMEFIAKRRELFVPLLALVFTLMIFLVGLPKISKDTSHERQNQTLLIAQKINENGFFSFWQPQANFGNSSYAPDYPNAQPYTVIRLEFPYHGILGYPFSKIFGFHRWIYATLSLLFSFTIIIFSWQLLRIFTDFYASSFGLMLLVLAPLFLHYGQVVMPDIIALTGLVASLYAAAYTVTNPKQLAINDRKNWLGFLISASLFSLVGILGKPSLLPYGLPVSLLAIQAFEKKETKIIAFFSFWLITIFPLVLWNLPIYFDPPYSWNIIKSSGDQAPLFELLLSPIFYLKTMTWVTILGVGIPGIIFSISAIHVMFKLPKYRWWLPSALFSIIFVYVSQRTYLLRELQYTTIIVFWLAFFVAIAIDELRKKGSKLVSPKLLLGLFTLHLIMVTWGVLYLKTDKFPAAIALTAISEILPPQAKVVQVSPSYGATPTYFLNRSTAQFLPKEDQYANLAIEDYQVLGYSYLVFFDYPLAANSFIDVIRYKRNLILSKSLAPKLYDYAQKNFEKVFEQDGVILFKMKNI